MSKSAKKVDPLVVTPPLMEMPLAASKADRLQLLYNDWFRCGRCMLGQTRPMDDLVFAHGNPDSGIMIIGEAPGEEEEQSLIPFVGASGRLLNRILAMYSSDMDIVEMSKEYERNNHTKALTDSFHSQILDWRKENFFVSNVVACRPPDNRPPIKVELEKCWERVWNMIYIVDPLVIVAVGKTAATAVLQLAKFELMAHRGEIFDVRYHGLLGEVRYPVIPVLHPSYLLRVADWKSDGGDWKKSLKDWAKVMHIYDQQRFQHYGIPVPARGTP